MPDRRRSVAPVRQIILFLIANIVTTSKALVTRSDALVTRSFLFLIGRKVMMSSCRSLHVL